jgi:hypothetical protein
VEEPEMNFVADRDYGGLARRQTTMAWRDTTFF